MRLFLALFGFTELGRGLRAGQRGASALAARRFALPTRNGEMGAETTLGYHLAERVAMAEIEASRAMLPFLEAKARLSGWLQRERFSIHAALAEYVAADDEHERDFALRAPQGSLPAALYPPIVIQLAAIELVVNAIAFSQLRLPWHETYALAALPSIAGPVLAHFAGIAARQTRRGDVGRWWTLAFGTAAVIGLSVLTVGVGELRSAFVGGGATATWVAAMNAVLFLAAATTSYATHDSSAALERVVKTKRRLERRIRRRWAAWNRLAARYGTARARAMTRVDVILHEALAQMDEYLDGMTQAFNETDFKGTGESWITNAMGTELFTPRDFGPEIQPTPFSLDELIAAYRVGSRAFSAVTGATEAGSARIHWIGSALKTPPAAHTGNGQEASR